MDQLFPSPALVSIVESGTLNECSKGHLIFVGDVHVAQTEKEPATSEK